MSSTQTFTAPCDGDDELAIAVRRGEERLRVEDAVFHLLARLDTRHRGCCDAEHVRDRLRASDRPPTRRRPRPGLLGGERAPPVLVATPWPNGPARRDAARAAHRFVTSASYASPVVSARSKTSAIATRRARPRRASRAFRGRETSASSVLRCLRVEVRHRRAQAEQVMRPRTRRRAARADRGSSAPRQATATYASAAVRGSPCTSSSRPRARLPHMPVVLRAHASRFRARAAPSTVPPGAKISESGQRPTSSPSVDAPAASRTRGDGVSGLFARGALHAAPHRGEYRERDRQDASGRIVIPSARSRRALPERVVDLLAPRAEGSGTRPRGCASGASWSRVVFTCTRRPVRPPR